MNGDDVHDESQRDSLWQTYKVPIVLGSISLLLIVISIYLLIKTYHSPDPIQFLSSDAERIATNSAGIGMIVTIDISGAISKPNVYRLPVGSRVDDAIVIAGGFTKDADVEKIAVSINRAAKLSDGAKIYIPTKGGSTNVQGVSTIEKDQNISSQAQMVSINMASSSELEALNGVGPATSAKIIAGRPYSSIEELVEKKIISQSLFEKLKMQLTL